MLSRILDPARRLPGKGLHVTMSRAVFPLQTPLQSPGLGEAGQPRIQWCRGKCTTAGSLAPRALGTSLLDLRPPQAQGICDYRNGAKTHGQSRDHG